MSALRLSSLLLLCFLTTCACAATTTRISVSSSGVQSNHQSDDPSTSADGRYVAFMSYAGNLVAGDDNGGPDVFRHDRLTGQVLRMSVSSGGAAVFAPSYDPSITADGRLVAFMSTSNDLIANDSNMWNDIFLHDCVTGDTTLISLSSLGGQGNDDNYSPSISADGRYVAFVSGATQLVTGDTNNTSDVFVRDLATGTTTMVSRASDGSLANDWSFNPAISADGRYVAFESYASNLVTGDTNDSQDVFIHDRTTGATTRVSVSTAGTQANYTSHMPCLSGDGRYVAFHSYASNLVTGDTNTAADVFVRDRSLNQTTRVSVNESGAQGAYDSVKPSITADGRYVAFGSDSSLVSGDSNSSQDVFVRDRVGNQTTRHSLSTAGGQGNGASGNPSIASAGGWIAWVADASNLVTGDTNGVYDVFVRDTGLASAPAPTVIGKAPTGTDCSAQSPVIKVTFSVPMNKTSAQGAFSLEPTAPGKFVWSGNQMRYVVSTALLPNKGYRVTIGTGARSAQSVNMASAKSWSFRTNSAPAIALKSPTGTAVSTSSAIRIGFNMAMNKSSVHSAFSISPAKTGTFSWSGNEVTFTPSSALSGGARYTVTLAATAKSGAGVSLAAPYSWQFTTVGTIIVPRVVGKSPQGDTVGRYANVKLVFSIAMNKASVHGAFKLRRASDAPSAPDVAGSFSWSDGKTMVFDPTNPLAAGTGYEVTLSRTATSVLGIPLADGFDYQFHTVSPTSTVTVAAMPTAAGASLTVNLSAGATVRTVITNIAGRVVAELPERDLPEGISSLLWNGRGTSGTRVPAGWYLVRVEALSGEGGAACAVAAVQVR